MQNFWLHKQNRIQEILDNFDFDKVQSVMQHLNWTWSLGANTRGIPEIDDLKKLAKELLEDADANGYTIGSGGFEAKKLGDELTLQFIIE